MAGFDAGGPPALQSCDSLLLICALAYFFIVCCCFCCCCCFLHAAAKFAYDKKCLYPWQRGKGHSGRGQASVNLTVDVQMGCGVGGMCVRVCVCGRLWAGCQGLLKWLIAKIKVTHTRTHTERQLCHSCRWPKLGVVCCCCCCCRHSRAPSGK